MKMGLFGSRRNGQPVRETAVESLTAKFSADTINNVTNSCVEFARQVLGESFRPEHEPVVRVSALMSFGCGLTQSAMFAADMFDAGYGNGVDYKRGRDAFEALLTGLGSAGKVLDKRTREAMGGLGISFRSLSDHQRRLLSAGIAHAQARASALFRIFDADSSHATQALHSVGVLVAAIYTSELTTPAGELSDLVADVQGVPKTFREFLSLEDVGNGIEKLVNDGRKATADMALGKLAHMMQIFLLVGATGPDRGPSSISAAEQEQVVKAAADIGADAMSQALVFRASTPSD